MKLKKLLLSLGTVAAIAAPAATIVACSTNSIVEFPLSDASKASYFYAYVQSIDKKFAKLENGFVFQAKSGSKFEESLSTKNGSVSLVGGYKPSDMHPFGNEAGKVVLHNGLVKLAFDITNASTNIHKDHGNGKHTYIFNKITYTLDLTKEAASMKTSYEAFKNNTIFGTSGTDMSGIQAIFDRLTFKDDAGVIHTLWTAFGDKKIVYDWSAISTDPQWEGGVIK